MYNIIRLSEQLSEKHIIIHSASTTADEILREMVQILSDELTPEDCEGILTAVKTREKVKTTGIGYGVAVPHGRTSLVKRLYCVAATSEKGIEFAAMDGKPAHLFFLIISPEYTVGPHLSMISVISHLVSKNPKISGECNTASTAEEFMNVLREKEDKYTI